MQVNRVQSNNNQPTFGAFLITEKGISALRRNFSSEQLKQIESWRKELKNTKHFDLELDAVSDVISFKFKHQNNQWLDSAAPLHPVSLKDNQLHAYGIDLIKDGDAFSYQNLRFPTSNDAAEAYSRLSTHENVCMPYRHNDFKRIYWAVDSTKILDKAAEYTGSSNITQAVSDIQNTQTALKTEVQIKPSFIQRLKNAWHIIKGN